MAARNAKSLEDLDTVSGVIYEAGRYQLTAEVILWSLYYMKEHSKSSIEEALSAGMQEWDI